MIRWLTQSVADHPDLTAGRPPDGLLTPAELAHYNGYYSPRRRRDWLLGRWTAKRLIQRHMAATSGFQPPLDSFTIAQDPSGAPYVASEHPALAAQFCHARMPISISISHSHGYAFCAVTDHQPADYQQKNQQQISHAWAAAHLGADIELIDRRNPTFADDFFTRDEQFALQSVPSHQRAMMNTATWSAKEAVLKAIHLGLRADPHQVQCLLRADQPRMWTPFLIEMNHSLHTMPSANGTSDTDARHGTNGTSCVNAPRSHAFCGWWRLIDNRLRPGSYFVLTLAAQGVTL